MRNFMTMKAMFFRGVLLAGSMFISVTAPAQCDIQNYIYPDGSMLYAIEPVNFYWTQSKSLKGGVVTDRENYFLALQPVPFPDKETGHRLKDDLEIKLSNDSTYILEHFDTRYLQNDSILQLLYLIDKENLQSFLDYEAVSARINMEGEEGARSYVFKLHKSAIREQLACFLNEAENRKKK